MYKATFTAMFMNYCAFFDNKKDAEKHAEKARNMGAENVVIEKA